MSTVHHTDRMLKLREVAQFLGVHPATVRHWCSGGLLSSYASGPRKIRRLREEEMDTFVEKHCVGMSAGRENT